MFRSVINQPAASARRFGVGVWMSLMVHAGVFVSVLGLSGKAVEKFEPPPCDLGPFRRTVPTSRGDSTPRPVPESQPRAQPTRKHRPELVQPRNTLPPPPDEMPRKVEPAASVGTEGTTTTDNASASSPAGPRVSESIGDAIGPDLVQSLSRLGTGP